MDPSNDGSNPFMDGTAPVPTPAPKSAKRKVLVTIALVAAGIIAGAAITGTVVANANGKCDSGAASSVKAPPGLADSPPSLGGGDHGPGGDGPGGDMPPRPQDLTGDALTKVTAAVAAQYPGATVERAGQLPDGTYVAHVVATDGEKYVALDADFVVTGELSGPPGPGGPEGDPRPGDGDHGPGDDDGE